MSTLETDVEIGRRARAAADALVSRRAMSVMAALRASFVRLRAQKSSAPTMPMSAERNGPARRRSIACGATKSAPSGSPRVPRRSPPQRDPVGAIAED